MASPVLIDAHLHIYETREEGQQAKAGYHIWEYGEKPDVHFSQYGGNLEDALDAIDKAGFSKAVVVNLFSGSPGERSPDMADQLKEYNRWGCDLARPHSQLVPYISTDPSILPGEEGAAHVREMAENHGARGVKLHPLLQQFEMGDERMWPVYETCVDLGIPIVSHSGPARDGRPYGTPKAFAAVLQRFPDLKLVLAHMGGGAWRETLEIAGSYPHAYFDCCEIMEWTGSSNGPTYEQLAQLIKEIGPERVLMGSDFPWYDLDRSVKLVMELPGLSQEEKEGILGANAIRILDL
ncbi:MAG: amidohydrolase family protein [Dehalococcoidia bacterium]